MALQLKDYQLKALGAIEAFLAAARGATDAAQVIAAFDTARSEALGEAAPRGAYRASMAMPALPQCCIRIPTGGGKTLLAAHAIERAARLYVGTSTPVALWLVPSNAIRTQTLDALKTPGHPYREALLAYYPADRLAVLDIANCEQLRAQDFGGRAIVVVATMQTLRVGNTASREVYAYKECFEPHFAGVGDAAFFEVIGEADLAAQPYLKRADLGKVKRSFANLLALHRPVVIVDEAHNAQTELSSEVLARIRPACVIEWTATPARDQNVLYHVSAQELKSEAMIKLPIVLAPHPNWHEAVRDAVLTRDRLTEAARDETDYLRPIVLFQAEPKGGEATVEVLKAHLVETLKIEERRIAVATGRQRELDGVNLFDPACAIDFVITVEALKEGWDCSFAYVFCTAQNVRSAKDMEQLLGRVLRLPYARRRNNEVLNRAYAHVCGSGTAQVANQLADRLVAMGFEQMEAAQSVQMPLGDDLFAERVPQPAVAESSFELPVAVAEALALALAGTGAATEPIATAAEKATLTLRGVLTTQTMEAALAAVPRRSRDDVSAMLQRHQTAALTAAAPAERGVAFSPVPRLALEVQGELLLLEPELLSELADYSLSALPTDLPDFQRAEESKPYLLDVERGQVAVREDKPQWALDLDAGHEGIRREDVIRALDQRLRRESLLQPDLIAWLGRTLDGLLARGFTLTYLARHLNALAASCARRLDALLKAERKAAFQHALLGEQHVVRLDALHEFHFDAARYPARWLYAGRWRFGKHWYPLPGELDADDRAEETACAIELDGMPEIRHWIRNLERQPLTSFWLPTSTDRFYPDFVAQLDDDRLFVIEYKGGDRYSNDDSREKRDIGSVWAAASAGRCVFAMVTDAATAGRSVAAQLRSAVLR